MSGVSLVAVHVSSAALAELMKVAGTIITRANAPRASTARRVEAVRERMGLLSQAVIGRVFCIQDRRDDCALPPDTSVVTTRRRERASQRR